MPNTTVTPDTITTQMLDRLAERTAALAHGIARLERAAAQGDIPPAVAVYRLRQILRHLARIAELAP